MLYSPKLWVAMLPYGTVYVCIGQMFWLMAIQKVIPLYISIGTTCLFILILMWSAALLNVWPTMAQWIGSSFLFVSIVSSVTEIIYNHNRSGPVENLSDVLLPIPTDEKGAIYRENTNPIREGLDDRADFKGAVNVVDIINNRSIFYSIDSSSSTVSDFDFISNQGGGLKGF